LTKPRDRAVGLSLINNNCIIFEEYEMNLLKSLLVCLFVVSIGACSTMEAVWEGGKTVVTGTVDAVVGGTSQIVSAVAEDVVDTAAFAADTTAGLVEASADFVDGQTDSADEKSEAEVEEK
jgi:hypothetical protein